MKKFMMKATLIAAFVVVAGYGVYTSQKSQIELSDTALANVEALAQYEQPNVEECVEDEDSICEALHPTDPGKDKKRIGYKWPS